MPDFGASQGDGSIRPRHVESFPPCRQVVRNAFLHAACGRAVILSIAQDLESNRRKKAPEAADGMRGNGFMLT